MKKFSICVFLVTLLSVYPLSLLAVDEPTIPPVEPSVICAYNEQIIVDGLDTLIFAVGLTAGLSLSKIINWWKW